MRCISRMAAGSEWSIRIFPLIARRDGRDNLPMLHDLAAREPEQVVIRSGSRVGASFDQREHEIAVGYEATRNKGRPGPAFRDLGKPPLQPLDSVANQGRVLDELVIQEVADAVEAHL